MLHLCSLGQSQARQVDVYIQNHMLKMINVVWGQHSRKKPQVQNINQDFLGEDTSYNASTKKFWLGNFFFKLCYCPKGWKISFPVEFLESPASMFIISMHLPNIVFNERTTCAFVHVGCISKFPKLLCSAYILLLHSCGPALGRAYIFS